MKHCYKKICSNHDLLFVLCCLLTYSTEMKSFSKHLGDVNSMTSETSATGERGILNDLKSLAFSALVELGALARFDKSGNLPIDFFINSEYLNEAHSYFLQHMIEWESAERIVKRQIRRNFILKN